MCKLLLSIVSSNTAQVYYLLKLVTVHVQSSHLKNYGNDCTDLLVDFKL